MEFRPHNYQKVAIDFIKNKPEAAVFLPLGYGKSVITLTAIKDLQDQGVIKKVLVVAPKRVARDQWSGEVDKWEHLHCLRVSIVIGTAKQRLAALDKEADIYVISRDSIKWLADSYDYNDKWDMVVLDELTSFKSGKTGRWKAMNKIRSCVDRVVGLTGTPAPNGLMDLWAEFAIIDGGLRLGGYISHYRNRYFDPDKRGRDVIYTWKLKEGAAEKIYAAISDITISMDGVLDMPELFNNNYVVHMSDAEKSAYDVLKRDMVLNLPDGYVAPANAAALSSKLLQMASGTLYGATRMEYDYSIVHDAKLEALDDIIEASDGNPVLVSYWFRSDKDRIIKHLEEQGISYVIIDKKEDIDAWNRREAAVGLIQPTSAGTGINLQFGGNTIVWYTLPWSLEAYSQTLGRIYRQGQQACSVVNIRLIADGTIDEQVLAALDDKDCTQARLLEAVRANLEE